MKYVMETVKLVRHRVSDLIHSKDLCPFCSQVCIDRCLERGKSSGRTDDNRESLEKRYNPAHHPKKKKF